MFPKLPRVVVSDLGQGEAASLELSVGGEAYWNYDDDDHVCGDLQDFLHAGLIEAFHGAGAEAGGGGGEHENHDREADLLGEPVAAVNGG